MNCAVIFGGCGFIGLFYAERAIELNLYDKLYLIDIKKPTDEYCKKKYLQLINTTKVHFIERDIRVDLKDIKISEDIKTILNFAAIHREPGHQPNEYFDTNIKGAKNICNFAEVNNCNDIVFTSSIAVYGQGEHDKNEDTITKPTTPYGKSKLLAEEIHIKWRDKSPENNILAICRPGVVYGPGEKGNVTRLVKFIKKKIFFYMGNKDIKKGGIYIKELINILIFVNQNQLNKKDSNFALFNATLFPCPTLENYAKEISNIFNYTGSFFTIPKFMINILLFISLCFTKVFKQNNSFSYYRLIKLFRSNNIVPKYLIKKNYVFTYNLNKSFNNWKKINPTDW